MSKHILGPWEYEHEQCDPKPYPDDPGFFTINAQILDRHGPVADTMNRDHCISPEEDEANARLIAAAPELLEALKDLTELGDNVPVFQLDDGKSSVKAVRLAGTFMKAMDAARAAIAKACGPLPQSSKDE